jgi:2-C-methyl-D-erythritol 2,4-cyclodiphosphate synthase
MDSSQPAAHIRIGHGYDLHRLEPLAPAGQDAGHDAARPFVLAGVEIRHDRGPVGHSDGDAVYHAVTDAILGALALPDIGELFPDTDPAYRGADSAMFVEAAAEKMRRAGYAVGNLDVTVICERPKLSPQKRAMIANIARLLGCDVAQVNLKGKTHEKVDAVGEGRAIEVHVVALLMKT